MKWFTILDIVVVIRYSLVPQGHKEDFIVKQKSTTIVLLQITTNYYVLITQQGLY